MSPAFHLPLKQEPDRTAPILHSEPQAPSGRLELQEGTRGEINAQREADRVIVTRFAPPAVLVNAELQVLQFRGPTGEFLELPTGKASFDVLKMAREGLMLPLRSAINQARQENKTARKENVRINRNGKTRTVDLEVIPLKNLPERCFLILFKEGDEARQPSGRAAAAQVIESPVEIAPQTEQAAASRIVELETDVTEMREYFQSMQEQHEAANEELQASSEEIQSANEELQSVNEELETSKEELESANEELTTVNDEMSNRNVELTRLYNDLINLQSSTRFPIVLLGRDLTIRWFGPQAAKQFGLLATDVGRPINHIRHSLVLGGAPDLPLDLERLSSDVVSEVSTREHDVREKNGERWYSLRVSPYLTVDSKVDGAVLVLVDITERKRQEAALRRLATVVLDSNDAITLQDLEGRILAWNRGAERMYGYSEAEALQMNIEQLVPPGERERARGFLQAIRDGNEVWSFRDLRG